VRKGIVISVFLHLLVLAWAFGLINLPAGLDFVEARPVQVAVLTPSDASRSKKAAMDQDLTIKLLPKADSTVKKNRAKTRKRKRRKVPPPARKRIAEQKKVVPAETKKKLVRQTKPQSQPTSAIMTKTKASARSEPVRVAKAKAADQKKQVVKPEVIKSKAPLEQAEEAFNPDKIAALLNKIPDPVAEPAPVGGEKLQAAVKKMIMQQTAAEIKPHTASNGRDKIITASEIDAFRAQVSRCWSPPPGGLGAGEIAVRMQISLNSDGTLVTPPQVRNYNPSPFFKAASEAAVRAIWQCQPYNMPKEKYSSWKDMVLRFDPSKMYEGV
jgi:hypothetical protein